MSYVTVATTFCARIGDRLFMDYPAAVLYLDNNKPTGALGVEATKPTPNPDDAYATFYVRQTLIPNGSRSISLGGTDWSIGRAIYDIFVPLDSGPIIGPTIAQTIRSYFRLYEANGVSCISSDGDGPSWMPIGTTDSGRYQFQVEVPWQYVEYPSIAEEDPVSNYYIVTHALDAFAVKDVVAFDSGTGAWEKVVATDAGLADISEAGGALAGVVTQLIDRTHSRVVVSGTATLPSHGWPVGQLWVSTTVAGDFQTTLPAVTEWVWLLAVAPDDSHIVVLSTEPQKQ